MHFFLIFQTFAFFKYCSLIFVTSLQNSFMSPLTIMLLYNPLYHIMDFSSNLQQWLSTFMDEKYHTIPSKVYFTKNSWWNKFRQIACFGLWLYWFWSFKSRDTRFEIFLPKNQHTLVQSFMFLTIFDVNINFKSLYH